LRQSSRGQDYYLVPDPLDVLVQLHKAAKLPEERLEEIDALAEMLDQTTLSQRAAGQEHPPKKTAPSPPAPGGEKTGG
jgi:hypothetical protein